MNSFGRVFRISIYGESHGPSVGVIIDGCPAGIAISISDFEQDLLRRKTGITGTSSRKETDIPTIQSGVFNSCSTGSPILISFNNQDTDSSDYENYQNTPRPGHADFTAMKKFNNFNDYRGGGHFSGRITIGLVAAGVIAKKIISPISIEVKLIQAEGSDDIETTVKNAKGAGDSVGSLIECRINNVPVGLGEPFFDSVESLISHLIFSIPAVKAIEFGAGFATATMRGSQCNDLIENSSGKTRTNNSGGINGGISNGNEIIFRVAIKPASSIKIPQETYNFSTKKVEELLIKGRHDSFIGVRALPVVEAAAAIALADLLLTYKNN
ncbi:MAG: chorismate synthase [Candidatus Kapabacteria bacterium]|nr:chorismate synthase [Candidatus Kapabacteria bacterium]